MSAGVSTRQYVSRPLPGVLLCVLALQALLACSAPQDDGPRKAIPAVLVEPEQKTFAICRADLLKHKKAGPAHVMRWYLPVPFYRADGSFLGYEIRSIVAEPLADGPLLPGDVLVSVNGLPIEKPGQVDVIWAGLDSVPAIVLSIYRNRVSQTISIPVNDCGESGPGQ